MAEEETRRRRFANLRSVRWRVDLGILPASPGASVDELRRAAADSRRRYVCLRRRLMVDPHLPKDEDRSSNLVVDNPLSQNPDFTPSRGSTPNYQPRAQTVMSNMFQPDAHRSNSPEPSPTGRRKLAELLQEAMQNGPEEGADASKDEQQQQLESVAADGKPVSESTSSSACSCSMVPTPTAVAKSRKERAWYTGRCCLPSFVHSLTLDESERGQKMSSRPCAV